ncbi:competence protein ComK [Neobacillus cucumis]|uniref:Competence protein n=1 Tax=Neobacillus cucumis TaxID=1740721 RepID=A0A2N5H8V4_9BACI|nr:competence protein ComK [Neobacillus cucumis]PLS01948.1 hypothetical protein CVD27_22805 [Neobacillus cucumis]
MELRQDYLINEKTGLLLGEYYTNGALYTRVIEGVESFLVEMSPIKLIDKSLLRYGSSFHGALSSSKEVLGGMYMYPIKISSTLDIWLFPSKSYKKANCIWFVLNHILDTFPKSVQHTEVFLRYGHNITIELRECTFRTKRRNAEKLRERISNNINNSSKVKKELKNGFFIKEEEGEFKFLN